MCAHREYWTPRVETGVVVAMGPVADPAGGYGVAIIEAGSQPALEAMQASILVIAAGLRLFLRKSSHANDRGAPEHAAHANYLRHSLRTEGRLAARAKWRLKFVFRRWAS